MPFETPTAVERAFYEAFVNRDLEAMRRVWSDEATAACVHPGGGLLLGPKSIMQSWADIFHGATAPQLQVRPIQVRTDAELALHLVEERIRSADQSRAATVIATNVYQRTADGWLMRLHHASLPLVETESDPATAPPPLH
jgi:ketosteroid isomerase-like protein